MTSEMQSIMKGGGRNTILTTATNNAAKTLIVEFLQAALILYAQWPGLPIAKQDYSSY